MIVQNDKPNLVEAISPKPNTMVAYDPKPNMSSVISLNELYYPVTVTAGMPMGLLLSLTYKDGFTIQSSYSP